MHVNNNGNLFSDIVEKLLSGEVICQFTDVTQFEYLTTSDNEHQAGSYLRKIGRLLVRTSDGSGFYAAYKNIDQQNVRQKIRTQFSQSINQLEPLVIWLRLVLSAQNTGSPLRPGDTLNSADLQNAIIDAQPLNDDLEKLANSTLFRTQSSGAKKQLDAILKKLCDLNYLVPKGKSGVIYIATAKWGRLYEVLEFINAHEQLDNDEDVPVQQEFQH